MIDLAVPLITAGGTVLAAILTGFGAAALKRRWDEKAESQRWNRERSERRREELRLALIQYFEAIRRIEGMGVDVWLARKNESTAEAAHRREQGRRDLVERSGLLEQDASAFLDSAHFAILVNGTVAGDLLMMLLGPVDAAPFTDHIRNLDDWVVQMAGRGAERADSIDPPDKLPLVRIAHRVLAGS